jgi:hypothetical protein
MFSAKINEKSKGKMKQMRSLAFLLVPVIALILGAPAAQVWAEPEEPEISEFEVFFEFNSTDLDLGFDIFLDADPWIYATVTAPDGTIFIVDTEGGLENQGNTEIFTESAEPPFCEDPEDEVECTEEKIAAAIAAFQGDFPEGVYTVEVVWEDDTWENGEAEAELSHDLPAAPDIRRPREGSKLKKFKFIKWRKSDDEIIEYEVVAEMVVKGEDDEERTYVNTATLPGNAKKFTISPEFRKLANRAKKQGKLVEVKAEVIARGENLNKTITEVPVFEAEEEGD